MHIKWWFAMLYILRSLFFHPLFISNELPVLIYLKSSYSQHSGKCCWIISAMITHAINLPSSAFSIPLQLKHDSHADKTCRHEYVTCQSNVRYCFICLSITVPWCVCSTKMFTGIIEQKCNITTMAPSEC